VDLGFAGRYKPKHSVHQVIASLSPTDPLSLRQQKGRWELLDHKERTVGRLSQAFTPPKEMTCIEARITAIINRRQEDCEPEYQDHVSCERWEVIIPELVFAPS
jgi:ATP-dependent DNA helicase RecQ